MKRAANLHADLSKYYKGLAVFQAENYTGLTISANTQNPLTATFSRVGISELLTEEQHAVLRDLIEGYVKENLQKLEKLTHEKYSFDM